jgi:hypothetical protein
MDPVFFGGLRYGNFDSVDGYMPVRAHVRALLFFVRPYAILLAVALLVFEALKRMFWGRPVTHVVKEVFKSARRNAPALANGDPAPTISVIVRPVRLVAAAPHIDPDSIYWRAVHAVPGIVMLFHAWSYHGIALFKTAGGVEHLPVVRSDGRVSSKES